MDDNDWWQMSLLSVGSFIAYWKFQVTPFLANVDSKLKRYKCKCSGVLSVKVTGFPESLCISNFHRFVPWQPNSLCTPNLHFNVRRLSTTVFELWSLMSVQFFAQVKGNIHLTEFSCNMQILGRQSHSSVFKNGLVPVLQQLVKNRQVTKNEIVFVVNPQLQTLKLQANNYSLGFVKP